MTDVFISYKREDRKKARAIAEALAGRGLDIWWDVELLAGQNFAEEINAVIKKAKAAIVLWTPESVDSHWVVSEAHLALDRKILIPAWLEFIELPAPFNTLHTLDLTTWNGSSQAPELEGIVKAVNHLIGQHDVVSTLRTIPEIEETLLKPAHELEFWATVSSKVPPSISEYRLYLAKYGEDGAFSDLAHHRINEITKTLGKRKWPSIAGSVTLIGVVVGAVLGVLQIVEIVVSKTDDDKNVVVLQQGSNAKEENTSSSANSTPVARRDNVRTDSDTPISGNLFGAEFDGADYDPDGDEISVFSVNGSTSNVGAEVELPSGASVRIDDNGDFLYDPRSGYEFLVEPGSSSADRVTYSLIDSRGAKSPEILSMFMVKKSD